jgi:hypothetical protein
MNKKEKQMLEKHKNLIQSDFQKVCSHVQREEDDWFINTIMIEGIDVPFKYKRKQPYKSLKGQRINITYYPHIENVAGFEIEVMNIVRIKVS